jgi:membrane protein DedA with SNARE-associated domain
MHTSAAVFIAFCRPGIIRFISGNKGIEAGMKPGIKDMGVRWFLTYSFILIFLHHILFFFLEVFRLDEIMQTFYRIILSSISTLILVLLVEYLMVSRKDKE